MYKVKGGRHAPIERRDIHTARHEHITGLLIDLFEWALNTIEDVLHNARTEFDGQRLALAQHRIADGQTS